MTEETEVSFAFDIRPDVYLPNSVKQIPVQLQLSYVAQDDSKQLKVITKMQDVTDDENKVARSIQYNRFFYLG